MAFTLNLNEFWEKIVFSENQDFEYKVYILHEFSSKIRKEFFRNNFMPFLKDLMKLVRDIEQVSYTKRIPFYNNPENSLDIENLSNPEILDISLSVLKTLLIEGGRRWNILLETIEFKPDASDGTINIIMPSSRAGIFLSYTLEDGKRYIMLKDIGVEYSSTWTWELELEYDIPKETIKHIIKEKISKMT